MKLPHFKLRIDPELNEDLKEEDFIAFTAEPAIELKGFKFKDKKKTKFFFNKEKQMVAGPLALNGEPIYRNEDGFEFFVSLDEEVIEMYIERMQSKKTIKFNDDHSKKKVDADIIYLWLVSGEDDNAFKKYGFKRDQIPDGSPFLVAKVNDKDFWEKGVKEQEKFGFSLEGIFNLVPIDEIKEKMAKNNKKIDELVEMAKKNKVSLNQLLAKLAEDEEDKVEAQEDEKEEMAEDEKDKVKAQEEEEEKVEAEKDEKIKAEEDEEEKVKAEEDEKEEKVEAQEDEVEEEVDEAKPEEVEVINEEKIIEIIQPKLDEIIAQIAELRNIISEGKSEAEDMEMSEDKQEFTRREKLGFMLNMLSEDDE